MTGSGLCPSCFEQRLCTNEWPESVTRPANITAGSICADCYGSLLRYLEITP